MESLLTQIETVKVETLTQYPGNPRRGDVKEIARSLKANKQYAPLLVQLSTGHILSGNHTFQAAQSLGWTEIMVVRLDVTDEHARRIMLSSNRTADLAWYDEDAMTKVLEELNGDFDGTGWDAKSAAKYLKDEEPEPPLPEQEPTYGVIINCTSEEQQSDLLMKLSEEGLDVRALMG